MSVVRRVSFPVIVGFIVILSFVALVARGRPLARLSTAVQPLLVASGFTGPRALLVEPDDTLLLAEAGGRSQDNLTLPGRVVQMTLHGQVLAAITPPISRASGSPEEPTGFHSLFRITTGHAATPGQGGAAATPGPASATPPAPATPPATQGTPVAGATDFALRQDDADTITLFRVVHLDSALDLAPWAQILLPPGANGLPGAGGTSGSPTSDPLTPFTGIWGTATGPGGDGKGQAGQPGSADGSGASGTVLYATVPRAGTLLRVTLPAPFNTGNAVALLPVEVMAHFVGSDGRALAPTGVTVGPDGTVYVALLGADPGRPDGQVARVLDNGQWQTVYSGLRVPVALGFGAGGQLFVLEMASGYNARHDTYSSGTGRLLAVGPAPSRRREVLRALNHPTALAFSAAGDAFVAENGLNDRAGSGQVLWVPAQTLLTLP